MIALVGWDDDFVYREKINNLIDLGEDEEKITASLPKPNEIAEGLYSSEGINYLEKKKKQSKRTLRL